MTRQGLEQVALILAIGVAAFALLGLRARRSGRPWRRQAVSGGILGGLALAFLAYAYTAAPDIPTPPVPFTARFATNPAPDTPEVWARGAATYQKNCAVCHGPKGLGDGPAAFTLQPRPFNLQMHMPMHPPGETFYWISEGIPGTAMPPWKGVLSETERWELLRFLAALTDGRV